ncbi:hypothetical protein RI129_004718, partial [Pyrocoelia pectoralis]
LHDSGTLSLPSLHPFNRENEDLSTETLDRSQKYRRRPSSICSEDGTKSRPLGNGSFKTGGNGCAKLKRHNACRQKTRDVITLSEDSKYILQDNVRSKSLNHLDEIEMRQAVDPSTESALKDSKSEPDCAKSLSVPTAALANILSESTISTTSEVPTEPPARKHVLSRSQKSSSECYSVNFEVGDETTWDNELFFPAVRGVTIKDSLSKLCELRNIDLSSCDAWLQDKGSNTNTWMSFSQDTAGLVGKHIRITAKDGSGNRKSSTSVYGGHSRKPSNSNSKSRSSSFFNSSMEESNTTPNTSLVPETDASKKQGKQRWSGFFGNTKDTRMELLAEQLNNYAKNGIPNCQIYPQGQCESIDALYRLEGDWRMLIDHTDLNEKLQQQQTALWELIKTEVAYIKTLKVVTDLFLACLKNLQSANLLKEIDTEKLFSNITEILDANVLFWRNCIFPLVRDMRRYKQPPCIETMLQGFLKISDTFQAYFRYCAEQARCQHYCRENHTHHELFTAYLVWCETQKECNRLRLMDILVQPMQRLTKYGLLLKAILKNTDDDVERDNLNLMIKSVDDFVNSVNFSLKQKQDNERLKGIMARIESYDVVESKDDDLEKLLKSYTQLDLNKPMIGCPIERKRHLLLEGDLKLKDSATSKMEVHCFLLTDMLLVCKPSTKKGGATMRIIRQPYLIDRLMITELTRETPSLAAIYKNEFDLPVAAFILQNNDAKKLKSWKDSIAKAQYLYLQAKQMNYTADEALETDFTTDCNLEGDYHSLQLMPRSPLASSSRASRVSSLAHSHSGSVEMNDQSSVGSANQSRAVSVENENRTASISSDEGVQPLPPDKSPVSQKLSFKHRLFNKTPNTLSVTPYGSLGQSLPNLTLGSPNVGTLNLNLSQNTLSVPNSKNCAHLLSPTHRGVSYPPPSPTRGNLKRGLAISQNKNPPLLKTRHVTSTVGIITASPAPASFDFDVPVIAGTSTDDSCENFSRGQHRQAMLKRVRNDNIRYHTAGVVDDIKHNDNKDLSIQKRLSWNCSPRPSELEPDDQT